MNKLRDDGRNDRVDRMGNSHESNQWREIPQDHFEDVTEDIKKQKRLDQDPIKRHRMLMGLATLLMLVVAIVFVDVKIYSMSDVPDGIGRGVPAGETLAYSDKDVDLLPRDFTIEMRENMTSSRVLIWDFAETDGDRVTVKIDGMLVADNISIKDKPLALDIPIPCLVQVVGYKDGGDGITYGVKFPGALDDNAYFNRVEEGTSNAFQIIYPSLTQ